MAIEVAGRLYKKRSDAFYVNGCRVTEGWVNGIKVYPDDSEYSYFLKLGGRTTGRVFPFVGDNGITYNPVGTCECTASIKSKRKLYLAILNQFQPETSLGVYIERDGPSDLIQQEDVMVDVVYRLWCPDLAPRVQKYHNWSTYPTPNTASVISRLSTLSIHTGYVPVTSMSNTDQRIYSSDATHSIGIGKHLYLWTVNGNEMHCSEVFGDSLIDCRLGTYRHDPFAYDSNIDFYRTGLRIVAKNISYYYKLGEAEGPFTSDSEFIGNLLVLSPHLGTVMYGNLKRVYSAEEYYPPTTMFDVVRKMWEVEEGGSDQSVYPMSSAETSIIE